MAKSAAVVGATAATFVEETTNAVLDAPNK
jgi:hypothetical protein